MMSRRENEQDEIEKLKAEAKKAKEERRALEGRVSNLEYGDISMWGRISALEERQNQPFVARARAAAGDTQSPPAVYRRRQNGPDRSPKAGSINYSPRSMECSPTPSPEYRPFSYPSSPVSVVNLASSDDDEPMPQGKNVETEAKTGRKKRKVAPEDQAATGSDRIDTEASVGDLVDPDQDARERFMRTLAEEDREEQHLYVAVAPGPTGFHSLIYDPSNVAGGGQEGQQMVHVHEQTVPVLAFQGQNSSVRPWHSYAVLSMPPPPFEADKWLKQHVTVSSPVEQPTDTSPASSSEVQYSPDEDDQCEAHLPKKKAPKGRSRK